MKTISTLHHPASMLTLCALACLGTCTDRRTPSQTGLVGITRVATGQPGDTEEVVGVDLSMIATRDFWLQAPMPDAAVDRDDSIPAVDPQAAYATGHVTDEQTNAPVPGAVLRAPWQHEVLARTDADGNYRLAQRPETPLFVFAPGYQVGVVHETWNVVLERGHGLHGRIVDADGKPVVGQLLLVDSDICVTEDHTYDAIPWTARTDEQGEFLIEELAEGARYWLRTILSDGTPLELGEGLVASGTRDLGTVSTGPSTALGGTVSRRLGSGTLEGRVHVLRLYDHPPVLWRIAREAPSYPIDPDGTYRIPRLCPGRYELAFWLPDCEPEIRVFTAPPGGAELRLDVEVGAGRTFTGLVVDEAGRPIDRALLRAMPWADREVIPLVPPGQPDHNGRFLIGNVRVLSREDGSYELRQIRSRMPVRLTVEKEGYQTVELRIDEGASPPEIIRMVTS